MKKIIVILLSLFLTGCVVTQTPNTPEECVSNFLNAYQTQDISKAKVTAQDSVDPNNFTLLTTFDNNGYPEDLNQFILDKLLDYEVVFNKTSCDNEDSCSVDVTVNIFNLYSVLTNTYIDRQANLIDNIDESTYQKQLKKIMERGFEITRREINITFTINTYKTENKWHLDATQFNDLYKTINNQLTAPIN